MIGELIPVKFSKIMQTRTYTMILVGTEEKRFPIYCEPSVGHTLQLNLTETAKPRPFTHDLITLLFRGLHISVKQVVITQLEGTLYHAMLFVEQQLEGKSHIVAIDCRPSDCITLAFIHHCPVFCTREVYDAALAVEGE